MMPENKCEERLRVKPIMFGMLAWLGAEALFGILAAVILISRGVDDPRVASTYQAEPFFATYTLVTGMLAVVVGGLVAARCASTRCLSHAGLLGGAILLLLLGLRLVGFGHPSILRMALAIPLGLLGGFPVWLRRNDKNTGSK